MLGWVVGPMGRGGMVLMFGCFPWGEGDWGIDDDDDDDMIDVVMI